MKKYTYGLAAFLLFSLTSCSESDNIYPQQRSVALNYFNSVFTTPQDINKRIFSEALAESLHQSRQLREIIKTEALNRFNNDTEVLYVLIMNRSVENGSVHDLMASNTEGGRAALNAVLSELPLLSILVPTLPEGSFSAESWNTGQVPAVGIRLSHNNDTALIWDTNTAEVIPGEYIPGFPALAVKENERLVASTDSLYSSLNTNIVYSPETALPGGPNVSIRFMSNAFDGIAHPDAEVPHTRVTDPKLTQAYNYCLDNNDWQRDYVYYGIYSGQQNGPLDTNFNEAIGELTMDFDADWAYRKLANHTSGLSGYAVPPTSGANRNYWTEGLLDFNMKTWVNATSGETQINVGISINPADLFELAYTRHSDKKWLLRANTWYTVKATNNKVYYANAPITTWDVKDKTYDWQISAEEVDLAGSTLVTLQNPIQRFTNFTEGTNGEFIKLVRKWGATPTAMSPYTLNNFYTTFSNQFGDALMSFGDDVILETGQYRHYGTGSVRFTVEPVRVE